jgi:hypothetical protein
MRALDYSDEAILKNDINTSLVAVDVYEQAIERPVENQKECYSEKKHTQ